MPEETDRRTLIDPRYVTWETFNRRADEVDRRLARMTDDEALYRQRVADALGAQDREIVKLRIQITRLAVYISIAATVAGVIGGPLVTWVLVTRLGH